MHPLKAKVHLGFDINHSIPSRIFLTDGKGDKRPFVSKILSPVQTGIMNRYYQCHKDFDLWQAEGKHYVCRIKRKTHKTVIKAYHLIARSPYGLMVQILSGLIAYLLIAIYCHRNYNEKVSIKRVREVRVRIKNEAYYFNFGDLTQNNFKEQRKDHAYAKT